MRRNRVLASAIAGGILAQLVIVVWPPAQAVLATAALDPVAWLLTAAGGILPVLAIRALVRGPVAT